MIGKQRVVVVMPAYNAERTLERTVQEIDRTIVDDIVLVDDCSRDRTVEVARQLDRKRPSKFTRHRSTNPCRPERQGRLDPR